MIDSNRTKSNSFTYIIFLITFNIPLSTYLRLNRSFFKTAGNDIIMKNPRGNKFPIVPTNVGAKTPNENHKLGLSIKSGRIWPRLTLMPPGKGGKLLGNCRKSREFLGDLTATSEEYAKSSYF